jgi:hypothetical protein
VVSRARSPGDAQSSTADSATTARARRLAGGIRNKAERGELQRRRPIGFVWGDADGEVRMHDDEAIIGVLRTAFDRFAEMGSARQVRLCYVDQQGRVQKHMRRLPRAEWSIMFAGIP